MESDFATLAPAGSAVKIIANLPYNIGTELLVNWLTLPDWPPFYESLTLMFQREVAPVSMACGVPPSAGMRQSRPPPL